MGVGAVFISSLALQKLSKSRGAAGSEEESLASNLEPIVAFVVLGSIIIRNYFLFFYRWKLTGVFITDGLSIPFFSLGKRVHTRTLSLTLTTRKGEPEWAMDIPHADLTHVNNTDEEMTGDSELSTVTRQQTGYPSIMEPETVYKVLPPKAVHFPNHE